MAKLKSFDVTVAASITPQAISELLNGITKSTDIAILPLSTNAGEVYIGDRINQLWPIGTGLSVADFMSQRGEEDWELDKIFLRVENNGEGVHLLLSER